ncbi:GIN domain-containing protein [Winogradskyella poriferorum]|uniref:GIN domain-containing protein n=1 Tax=Winogradskyella poriferorum TaxID=307627 RepID=UPI003D65F06E
MKQITLLLLLVSVTSWAQIKGNKTIETQTFTTESIERVKINLYAKITIDQSSTENSISITADSNLFDLIAKELDNGELALDQIEWISPSEPIIIKIGAPDLKRVDSGTHDTTRIINVNNDYLQIMAPIGNVIVEGRTKELRLGAELATIDASEMIAEDVYVNLWKYGKITVNPQNKLWADVSNDGRLIYLNKPEDFTKKTKNGGRIVAQSEAETLKNPNAEFIKFKIKNNSSNRNQFYVVGPKPDGSKFSYGFPMMPNSKRNENWSVGTKVYKVSALGFKKLLVKIKKEDEGKVVNLF